jgi:hypothetical protein
MMPLVMKQTTAPSTPKVASGSVNLAWHRVPRLPPPPCRPLAALRHSGRLNPAAYKESSCKIGAEDEPVKMLSPVSDSPVIGSISTSALFTKPDV